MLDAAALDDGIDWALVGDGPVRERLVAKARSRGLDNVLFHPQVPLEEVPAFLAASDALLVTLAAHETFQGFVPSKLVDFMAAGKPILLAAAGESARLLEEAGAGIAVAPEDPAALAEAARRLVSQPEEADAMAARGRAYARERLRSVQAARLEELLLGLARR